MINLLKKAFVLSLLLIATHSGLLLGQNVSINNDGSLPDSSAILDIKSTTKGLLIPRAETWDISSPATGLLIFQPSNSQFYYYDGSVWLSLNSQIDDRDNDTGVYVEKIYDEDRIRFDLGGKEALKMEYSNGQIMTFNTAGSQNKYNLFMGFLAGKNTGLDSTFINSGSFNTGLGNRSLFFNTNGLNNVAIGSFSMYNNTTGSSNTGIGSSALQFNISGFSNTAVGIRALQSNLTGQYNVGVGQNALNSNKTGTRSVAVGSRAATFDTLATHSVYLGANAGAGGIVTSDKHSKSNNVMIGYNAGELAQGSNNIFLGFEAGQNESGDDKLYIENSNADPSSALIYGEFDNDLLRINGSLNINEEYTFPKFDGSSGRVLKTNGSGLLSWSPDNDGPWSVNGSGEPYYTSAYVGVGTNNPTNRLNVVHNQNGFYAARIDNQSTETKAYGLEIEIGPNSNPETTNIFVGFNDGNGTMVGTITGDGSGGVDYNTTSDRRLKQNIENFSSGIDLVKQIDAYSYEMKSNPGQKHIGFIAQELYEVLPQIVKGSPEATSIEDPMMVDYGKMTPVLLAAVKELIREKEELKEKVAHLEGTNTEMNDLKAQLDSQLGMILELTKSMDKKQNND